MLQANHHHSKSGLCTKKKTSQFLLFIAILCLLPAMAKPCLAQASRRDRAARSDLLLEDQEQLRAFRKTFDEAQAKWKEMRKSALSKWKKEKTGLYYWLQVESKYNSAFAAINSTASRRNTALAEFTEASLEALLGSGDKKIATIADSQASKHAGDIRTTILALLKSNKLSSNKDSSRLHQWRRVGAYLKRVLTIYGEATAIEAGFQTSKFNSKQRSDVQTRLYNAKIDFARAALDMLPQVENDSKTSDAIERVILVLRLQNLEKARNQALIAWALTYEKWRSGSESPFKEAQLRSRVFVQEARLQEALIRLNRE